MNIMSARYCVAFAAIAFAVVAFAQEGGEAAAKGTTSLAEARNNVGAASTDPEVMAAIMQQLSPEDQVAFLAEVNAAIDAMDVSNEEKAAFALNANKTALLNAAEGNVANILAEVFATAPVVSLGLINEDFAATLFNKDADPDHPYSAENFTQIAKDAVKKISDRTATAENAEVRNSFAMLMMVNASNGSVENLAETLAESLPEKSRLSDTVREDYVAASKDKNYDNLVADYVSDGAVADTAVKVDAARETARVKAFVQLPLSGVQLTDALAADLGSDLVNANSNESTAGTPQTDNAFGGFGENKVNESTSNNNAQGSASEVVPSQVYPGQNP